jgi:hypothetical protein
VIEIRNPVPGLTRDLHWPRVVPLGNRGPGSSPGRGSLCVNRPARNCADGSLRLHHGLAALRRDLCRTDREPWDSGRGTSGWKVGPHSKVQDSHPRLVRATRRLRSKPATGARHQALAARVEERSDRRAQSELAGRDRTYSSLEPVYDSAQFSQRSRVRPGTGIFMSSRSRT